MLCEAFPIQGRRQTLRASGGWGSQNFYDKRQSKVARLSALCPGNFYPSGYTPGSHFCQRLRWPEDHRSAGILSHWTVPVTLNQLRLHLPSDFYEVGELWARQILCFRKRAVVLMGNSFVYFETPFYSQFMNSQKHLWWDRLKAHRILKCGFLWNITYVARDLHLLTSNPKILFWKRVNLSNDGFYHT